LETLDSLCLPTVQRVVVWYIGVGKNGERVSESYANKDFGGYESNEYTHENIFESQKTAVKQPPKKRVETTNPVGKTGVNLTGDGGMVILIISTLPR